MTNDKFLFSYTRITIGGFLQEIEVVLKKWGNSVGAVFPKKAVEKEHLKAGQKARIILANVDNPLKKYFGTAKFSKPTAKILKEVDKELWRD